MVAEFPSSDRLHATCVALNEVGVLLSGRSGSGKSDLALRLIDRGARLVADDTTLLTRNGDTLVARAPEAAAGRMEVRGIGLVTMPVRTEAVAALLVELDGEVLRMPLDEERRRVAGIDLPVLHLDPRPASAAIKVELAVARLQLGQLRG